MQVDDGKGGTDTITVNVTIENPACAGVKEIPPSECDALAVLYASTGGASWTNHSNWEQTITPCSSPWNGVACTSGHVTSLVLNINNLTGAIPSQLANLTKLTDLELYNNSLTGSCPSWLGDLTGLVTINLDGEPADRHYPRA